MKSTAISSFAIDLELEMSITVRNARNRKKGKRKIKEPKDNQP